MFSTASLLMVFTLISSSFCTNSSPDYTGVYTDAGLYGTQENVEVKKVGKIYVLRIKPDTLAETATEEL